MLTFADGVHLNLDLGDDPSLLRSVSAFGKVQVPSSGRGLLLELLFGRAKTGGDQPLLRTLQQRKMVADKPSLDDPDIEARLDAMAGQWAWQRPSGAAGKLFAKLYKATLRAHARRKVFVQDFGQTPCMPETAVRRALLTGPGKQRILCIGDDDLVSVPLALLGHEVTVYDIDDVILIPFLNALAAEWKLPLKAQKRDLMAAQKPVRKRFDAVYTDPMSTRECFDLFLSRGLEFLRRGGRVYCCMHAMALETFQAVQRDMGFGLLARHHDFNHYYEEGFRENYYRSDLMELEKLASTRPVYPLAQEAYIDILSGELTNRQHHCCDILAVDPKRIERAHVERAIERIKDNRLFEVLGEERLNEERCLSYIAALKGGGYFGLSAYLDDHLVAYDLYPFSPGRDHAIREIMRQEVPQTFSVLVHKVARPYRPLQGPEIEAPKPARKKVAKKKVAKKKVAKKKATKKTARRR